MKTNDFFILGLLAVIIWELQRQHEDCGCSAVGGNCAPAGQMTTTATVPGWIGQIQGGIQ